MTDGKYLLNIHLIYLQYSRIRVNEIMYSEMQWGLSQEFTGLMMLTFILLQLCGSALVIFGRQSEIISLGCRMLAAYIVFVILGFPGYWSPYFFIRWDASPFAQISQKFRNFAKLGQLFLILAECMSAEESRRAGEKDPEVKKFLQLFGRLLLVIMLFFNIGNDSLEVSPWYSQSDRTVLFLARLLDDWELR